MKRLLVWINFVEQTTVTFKTTHTVDNSTITMSNVYFQDDTHS